ncbi:RNA polymerase sigma-70 factor [Niabella drilacis]|uniref:RNA polymerase sigma-70 factor, ECF subfamily n=1 Tax=Niabella drilacis (strain DSM 25811 / CCM 8410 / CCUG 62505 / LMG 26954 / E90) TaxID=1285928 RepID=A0A1G6L0T8_NIADE|nr:RNA polymerase sigma-70 factor [Niabella drilacis]SDC36950.1 RNA polymerase sigma-70 factor, ECF subfamily [Niabella drilacis]
MKTEEITFIKGLKNGETLAYTRIYDLYHERLYSFVIRFVKVPELAEDILQEVFLTLWKVRERVDSEQSLQAYLYKISRNCVFKALKKNARQQQFRERIMAASGAGAKTASDEERLTWKEYENILTDAIDALPVQRRKVFKLCRDEGKTYDGVAAELGISKNTVKEHMVLATRAIKLHISKYVDFQSLLLFLVLSCM